jgi:DNA-3-methyladenine glycosylase II
MNIASEKTVQVAVQHLISNDPVFKPLVERYGLCTLRPHTDYYRELVESIIGQQLSVKAAASIKRRFVELFSGIFPEPEMILQKTIEELRSAGLSNAKARYIQDLAQHILNGKIEFEKFDDMSNEEVSTELTAVKGIGEWTAHMFLMFCMGRLDILASSDLGIKNGIKNLYKLSDLPDSNLIKELAMTNKWHPYESVACWYIWRSLDNKPAI